MSRLTFKKNNMYYPKNKDWLAPDDGSNAARLIQVIGKYEDLVGELRKTTLEEAVVELFVVLKEHITLSKIDGACFVHLKLDNKEHVARISEEAYTSLVEILY